MAELGTSHGYNGRLYVGLQSAFGTPVAATDALPITRAGFKDHRPNELAGGVNSARGIPYFKKRGGLRGVDGSFAMVVRPSQLDLIGQMIFGYNATTAYAFHNSGTAVDQRLFTFEQDLEGWKKSEFSDCRISRATLRSGQSDLDLTFEADVIGAAADHDITMTTGLAQPTGAVLRHSDLVLQLGTSPSLGSPVTFNPESFSITVDHALDGGVFRNSLRRLAIPHGIRRVTMSAVLDRNTTTKDELDRFLAESGTPFAARAKWTLDGSNSAQFDAGYCFHTGDWPEMTAEAISDTWVLTWECFTSAAGSENELTATILSA